MTDTTTPTTPDTTTPEAPKPTPPAPPVEKTFTQEEVNALIAARLERVKSNDDADARIKALEEKVTASEQAAVSAIVAKAAASAHDPAIVAKLVDLDGLTSADGDDIAAKVAEFLDANPYLVKTDVTPAAPALTPAPGLGGTPSTDGKLLTEAELEAITAEELAASPEKLDLYTRSVAALRS